MELRLAIRNRQANVPSRKRSRGLGEGAQVGDAGGAAGVKHEGTGLLRSARGLLCEEWAALSLA